MYKELFSDESTFDTVVLAYVRSMRQYTSLIIQIAFHTLLEHTNIIFYETIAKPRTKVAEIYDFRFPSQRLFTDEYALKSMIPKNVTLSRIR